MKRWLSYLSRRGKAETDDQICKVIGIVSAKGAYSREDSGEHAHRKSDHGIGTTPLVAWRVNGGEIEIGNLVVSVPIAPSKQALAAFEAQFPGGTMIAASADKMPKHLSSMSLLRASEIHSTLEIDEELKRKAHEIMHPPPFTHPVLGEFKPHSNLPWEYYGHAQWDGYPIRIGIGYGTGPTSELSMLREQADRAAKLIDMQAELGEEIKTIIRTQLYNEWCDRWLSEGETPPLVDEWAEQFKVGMICLADRSDIEIHLETEFHVDGYRPSVSWTPNAGLSEAWVD